MKNVLLVEDDVILRHVLSGQLTANGFSVSEAQNGEEALEILKIEKPDVILLDLILPGIDGFEVLKQVKGDLLLKSIYIMVLSNLGDDEAIKKAFGLGADDYFVKAQYPIKSVIDKLNNFFAKSGGAPKKETHKKSPERGGDAEKETKKAKKDEEENEKIEVKTVKKYSKEDKPSGRHLKID